MKTKRDNVKCQGKSLIAERRKIKTFKAVEDHYSHLANEANSQVAAWSAWKRLVEVVKIAPRDKFISALREILEVKFDFLRSEDSLRHRSWLAASLVQSMRETASLAEWSYDRVSRLDEIDRLVREIASHVPQPAAAVVE